MLGKGLNSQIYPLYAYRVAVNHYTLNPTRVELREFRRREKKIQITSNSLKRIIECAKELYKCIKAN